MSGKDFKKQSKPNSFKELFGEKRKAAVFAICDLLLFYGSFILTYFIWSINGTASTYEVGGVLLLTVPCSIVTLVLMIVQKQYLVVWRYAGMMDLMRLSIIDFISLVFGMVLRGIFTFFRFNIFETPLLVVITSYLIFFLLSAIYRLAPRMGRAGLQVVNKFRSLNERVIVYGAGYTGAALVKRMVENPSDGYTPVAIIDDDVKKKGISIGSLQVKGDRTALKKVIEKYHATVIAIAISNITRAELRSIYDYIKQFNLRIMIASAFKDAHSEIDSDIISMRNIKIEDLLHRDEHTMDRALVDGFIKDKVIMVTGGAGSIGSELCRQALKYGCKTLVIFDRHENGMFEFNEELKKKYDRDRYYLEMGSVRDRQKLREVMERYKPDVVFHAAAYKHVPMMEISADESVKNNVFGTRNVIEQCDESGVKKFILISTDKAINPANVMGATKRVAELTLQQLSKKTKTQLAAVRFGNVLGSSGSVIPTFIKQINAGGPVTVTDKEMKRYFMTIPEAVRLVLQAGALADGGEVFVLDMGEPVYIYDLACDLIRMSGLIPEKDIEIKISGLRPGEKLFEELQYGDENVDKTTHKDIFICKLADVDDATLTPALMELKKAAEAGDKELSEKLLFELVPSEYRKEHNDKTARV